MCLISLAIDRHDRFPLVIAANRDERFARPAAPLAWWTDGPAAAPHAALLGGRDLAGGGTWMALGGQARMAMVTNVRDPARLRASAPSRGGLVPAWVGANASATDFWPRWAGLPHNPFNLLAADFSSSHSGSWWWADDRSASPVPLGAGIHGLSNAGLGTPWPKVRRLDAAVDQSLRAPGACSASIERTLFAALGDRAPVPDAELPDTGIGLERERWLGPAFIGGPGVAANVADAYGTRCSTLLIVAREAGRCTARLVERSFGVDGRIVGQRGLTDLPWPMLGNAAPPVDDEAFSAG